MLYAKAARAVLKALTLVLAGVLLVLIAGSIWLAGRVRRQVGPAVQQAVHNITGGLYKAQMGQVLVYPLGRRIVLENLVLLPDSATLDSLRHQGLLPDKIVQLRIPKLEVDGIIWEHLLQGNRLVCGSVALTNPTIEVQLGAGPMPFELRLPKNHRLAGVHIKRLTATGIRTKVFEWESPKAYFSVASKAGALFIANLQTARGRPLHFVDFRLSSGATQVHLPFVAHKLSAAAWQFNGVTKAFFMRDFRFVQQPLAGGVQRTLHQVHVPGLRVQGFRVVKDSTRPLYEIARVSLLNPQLNARLTRKSTDPFDSSARYFPQLLLQRAGIPLRIKQVTIKGGGVSFTQTHPRTGLEGEISCEDLQGTLGPVLLQPPHEQSLKEPLLANLTGRVQHRTGISIQATLSNRDPQQGFYLAGSMQRLEVAQIQQIARNLGLIQLSSGAIDSMTFTVRGNTAGTQTTLALSYTDLKLTPLRWDSVQRTLRQRPFLSLLANELLLFNSNPEPGKPLRRAAVEMVRKPYQSFFNSIWKSLYDGILETVVADLKLLQYARNKSATRQQRKEDRLHRKEERIERREDRVERREERER